MEIQLMGEKVTVHKKMYTNKRIALITTDIAGLPFVDLTVNLVNEQINKDEAFIDINNTPEAIEVLKSANVISGEPIRIAQSGFCQYPLYKINLD